MPIREPWSASDRFVPRAVVRPLQGLLEHEAAGGLVMFAAAVVALAWANSPWSGSYFELWDTPLRVELGNVLHLDHLSVRDWVNDALMTLFFLLVGAEIKREVVHGHLQDPRAVLMPVCAAVGGMVVPAAVYAAITAGGPGSAGWGIPMATDIAFAVGVVSLLGDRVPLAGKIFLLTLAVADDVGAIVVIAVFYTEGVAFGWLAAAAMGFLVIGALRRSDVQSLAPYLAVGTFIWLGLLESGVHATLAGVVLGLLTPAWPLRSPRRYPGDVRRLSDQIERAYYDRVLTQEDVEENEHLIAEVTRLSIQSTSPLARLERSLSPWVAYGVVPLFALANAGVQLSGDAIRGLVGEPVTLGVVLGLLVGKAAGVLLGAVTAARLGLGRLPEGTSWGQLAGLAVCAGIGFTVALFVTTLSLDDPLLADQAKVGILVGSLAAGVAGFLLLRSARSPAPAPAPPPAPTTSLHSW